jgi:HAE1 family hydrophobic/amphiphilic exporter-1
VPPGALGGFLGLALMNRFLTYQSLDVLTMLGFFILVGTVVNNSTLIVHQSLNHMREEGMEAQAAIREATRNRIRPIFMTIASNVFGMLPLVLFPGAGSELYRGLGAVVLGGLIVSTIFTLFLVPALFSLMLDVRAALARATKAALGRGSESEARP